MQAGDFYAGSLQFAVRSGYLDAVRQLLDAGADPEWNGYYDGSLIEMARERGYEAVARLLEEARDRRGRIAPAAADHPIHEAAQRDDVDRVRALLDGDPSLISRGDRRGGAPLHRAVLGSARRVITLLLDRGADVHAVHSVSAGASQGFWAVDLQAIDLAIWGINGYGPSRRDVDTARLLLAHGAMHDLTIAAALGDRDRIVSLLDQNPASISDIRASGKRPLSVAIESGHRDIAGLLLDRGADPSWPELDAARGASLHAAVSAGDRDLIDRLLACGADPNGYVNAGGNSVYAAKTPELRALMIAHGGMVDPYDLVWMNQDDEVMRRVTADPASAARGCGGVFTAVCTLGKRDLLMRLLEAGIRPPAVIHGCQTYLLENPELFRILLAHGMNPNLADAEGKTLLHCVCAGGTREHAAEAIARATLLLDAGASITSREQVYGSTPLAWAARTNMPHMVDFLLDRGAPINLADDEPWATPLAWATRRGHADVADLLRKRGASK